MKVCFWENMKSYIMVKRNLGVYSGLMQNNVQFNTVCYGLAKLRILFYKKIKSLLMIRWAASLKKQNLD